MRKKDTSTSFRKHFKHYLKTTHPGYICPICGNKDQKYVGERNGKPYCRKCITFRGLEATDSYIPNDSASYALHYELSEDQKRLSSQLVTNYKNGMDTLVHAVCGSGKTEIVLNVIAYAIRHKQRVGFAVPRRDVIKELYLRFKSIFEHNTVRAIYGGHIGKLEADLMCLTTHQLFRYKNYFDLLIIDEIDAFPYNGNDVLEAFVKRAVKGHVILLSATPPEEVIKEYSKASKMIVRLDTRFHGHPLPVPELEIHKGALKYYYLVKNLKRFLLENKPVFVFAPTIDICEQTYNVLRFLISNVNYVHSKCVDRSERIEDFRKGKTTVLVTTAVLERGVTLKNRQVIVFKADHVLYTTHALIQIAGRVGRKKEAPTGEVIFIADNETNEMVDAINEIKRANKNL